MQHTQRYVPPELEGTTSGNKLHQRRAPGTLRRDGSQTVRFEMPFAVWCHTCQPHAIIGQGVRFNAEKRKVGYYHSTPIWGFKLKHVACGGLIEIETDPQNTAYVVTKGGKARDYGDMDDRVREGEGGVPILTAAERERRREDAFARLEGRAEEKAMVKDNTKRIEELYRATGRDWNDPAAANKRIRSTFRHERKLQKRAEEATQALKERLGTDIDLLPETDGDVMRARLVEFGTFEANSSPVATVSSPFFRDAAFGRLKSTSSKAIKEDSKDVLRRKLVKNTRAAINPFGGSFR